MSSFSSSSSKGNRLRIYMEEDLKTYKVEPGSLLQIDRVGYSHWAVYIGEGQVCHMTVNNKQSSSSPASLAAAASKNAIVRVESFADMMGEDSAPVYVNNPNDAKWKPLPPRKIVERAMSKKGLTNYRFADNNCEHFANWCRYGAKRSKQAEAAGAGIVGTLGLVAATVACRFGSLFKVNVTCCL